MAITKEVLDYLFPYEPTPDDMGDLLTCEAWERLDRAKHQAQVLRGSLSRINHKLDNMGEL